MNASVSIPRGTRLIIGAEDQRKFVNDCASTLAEEGFTEIIVPSIDFTDVYKKRMGDDIDKQLYSFTDKGGREICLRPEVTATVSSLYNTREKDVKLWYYEKCWRYERPQAGRYREFFQLGVEILNPTIDYTEYLIQLSETLVSLVNQTYEVNPSAKRGLSYYEDGCGFEISINALGAQKQVVGGGSYKEGIGFAIGVDRLLLSTQQ